MLDPTQPITLTDDRCKDDTEYRVQPVFWSDESVIVGIIHFDDTPRTFKTRDRFVLIERESGQVLTSNFANFYGKNGPRTIDQIRALMEPLTDSQRTDLMSNIRSTYCEGCGRKQPDGRRCQCQNDE